MIARCVREHIAICLVGMVGVWTGSVWAAPEQVGGISANESGLSAAESVSARGEIHDEAGEGARAASERTEIEPRQAGTGAAGGQDSGEARASGVEASVEKETGQAEGTAEALGAGFESQVVRKAKGPGELKETGGPKLTALPSLWQTVGSLLIVLAVIIAATYLFRRLTLGRQAGGRSKGIELLARTSVNPKQSLCLVKLGGRLLLVGLSPNHMAALQMIEDPDEVAQVLGQLEASKSHSVSNSFGRMFQREGQHYAGSADEETGGEDYGEGTSQPWRQARGELSSLLSKVKGLSRMRFRS